MTRYTPLWEQQGSYAASQDRRLIQSLFASGALGGSSAGFFVNGMQVQPSSGFTLQIQPGTAVVPTANSTGSVMCVSDAVESLLIPTNPAPPAGQSRIDIVVIQPRGNDLDGGTNNDWIFSSVQGTPAASPVQPATPAGAAVIAILNIPTGLAAIAAANITDNRPFRLSGLTEPPLPAAAPFTSFQDPWGDTWVAKGGVYGGTWKKARDALHASAYRAAAGACSAATLYIVDTLGGASADPYGMGSLSIGTGGGGLILPLAGVWTIGTKVTVAPGAGTTLVYYGGFNVNKGNAYPNSMCPPGAVWGMSMINQVSLRFNAGDYVQLYQNCSGTPTGTFQGGATSCYINADYMGTG